MDNYFKIDDLEVQYPIYLMINGRKWNFKSEYQKKLKEIDQCRSVMDLLIDTGFFLGHKVYRSVPFLVTEEIRVKGDKRKYYIADYFFPNYNLIVMNYIDEDSKKKMKHFEQTMTNIGYDVVYLPPLVFGEMDYMELVNNVKGFRTSLRFRTVPETKVLPKYFKEDV